MAHWIDTAVISLFIAAVMLWIIDANIQDRRRTPEERARAERDTWTW